MAVKTATPLIGASNGPKTHVEVIAPPAPPRSRPWQPPATFETKLLRMSRATFPASMQAEADDWHQRLAELSKDFRDKCRPKDIDATTATLGEVIGERDYRQAAMLEFLQNVYHHLQEGVDLCRRAIDTWTDVRIEAFERHTREVDKVLAKLRKLSPNRDEKRLRAEAAATEVCREVEAEAKAAAAGRLSVEQQTELCRKNADFYRGECANYVNYVRG